MHTQRLTPSDSIKQALAIGLAMNSVPHSYQRGTFNRLFNTSSARHPINRYPTMVCSSPAEIAAWNATVDKKKMARHVRRMNARVYAKNLSQAAEAHQASMQVAA